MAGKKIELLAPAGTWEALEAAVNAGADAVYLGGKGFGARAYAGNFDNEEMARAITFAHQHRVRIYVTVNTLVDDSEMEELASYLLFLNNVGADGIIVQDLGVVRLAGLLVPELPLHASTQMTITNSGGVRFAESAGMVRSVLARELSLKEIAASCACQSEIETFIHGALCVCYSGQCLMSSLIGGRSGNRGRCAQPCRLPYRLLNSDGKDLLAALDAGQYLLSPKDMNTLKILPKLIEAGVVSYKIEGRMKRPEYVAVVVDIYRRAIDSYLAGNYSVSEEDLKNIEQIFNRDFTTAYLEKRPGRTMMSDRRPNNRGVLIGRVLKLDKSKNRAVIRLEKEIHVGDGLEFWVSVGGRVGIKVKEMLLRSKSVESAIAGEQVELEIPKGVRLNDRVFRTLDSSLMAYAEQFFGDGSKKRIPVDALVTARLGEKLSVTLKDDEGNLGQGFTEFIVEPALKRPLASDTVRRQVERLGDTEYCLRQLDLECDEGIMVPVSEINIARRKACQALDKARLEAFAPSRKRFDAYDSGLLRVWGNASRSRSSLLTVHCDSLAKVKSALASGAGRILFGGDCFNRFNPAPSDYEAALKLAHDAGREIAFATPRVVKELQLTYFERLFALWEKLGADYVYINNNGLWPLAKKHPGVSFIADMSLNIFNSQSLKFWQERGASGAVLSPELTMAQIEKLAAGAILPLECIVQGRLEMMVSEYCVGGSFLGGLDKGACKFNCAEKMFLEDRKDAKFPVATDQYCRMHILNAHELSLTANVLQLAGAGIASLRIDGRCYDEEALAGLVKLYRQVLAGEVSMTENLPGTTRGHYFRGVL